MKPSYQSNEFRTLGRILPLVAVALALVGPPSAWGQCINGQAPFPTGLFVTISPSVVLSGSTAAITAKFTLNSEAGFGNGQLGIDVQYVTSGMTWLGDVFVGCTEEKRVPDPLSPAGATMPIRAGSGRRKTTAGLSLGTA